MDELKDKFKTMFSRASNSANKLGTKKFAGQGHRLGTAEERGERPKVQTQRASAEPPAAAASSSRASEGVQAQHGLRVGQQQQQPSASATIASQQQSAPQLRASRTLEGQPTALPSRVTAPLPPSSLEAPAAGSPVPAAADPGNSAQMHVPVPSPVVPVTAEQVEHMQVCLAMISSQPDAAGTSMQVLSKLLANLLAGPQEAKYRHIRLNNPKIHSAVVQVEGALELLAVVGFEVHTAARHAQADNSTAASPAAAGDGDGFAVFLHDSNLGLVQEGLRQLQQALPAAQQQQQAEQGHISAQHQPSDTRRQQPLAATVAPPSGIAAALPAAALATPPAVQRARHTQVLLPAAPDTAVPDWFFERTGAEVKTEYMAMLRQRQAGELFASKAWKDAKLGKQGQGRAPTEATVRVRFPEGVCLQGCFHVSEAMSALFEWVTGALRDPAIEYELVAPNRKPLPLTGKVGTADLAPAVLLNFRSLSQVGHLTDSAGAQQSFLRDELLQQAQAD